MGIKKDRIYDKLKQEFYPITAFEYIVDSSVSGYNALEDSVGYRAIKNNIGRVLDSSLPTENTPMELVLTNGIKLFRHSTWIGNGSNLSLLSAKGNFVPLSSAYFKYENNTINPDIVQITSGSEKLSNKLTSLNVQPVDHIKYPSAKAVYDRFTSISNTIINKQDVSNMQVSGYPITKDSLDTKYPSSLNVYNFLKNNGAITLVDTTYNNLCSLIEGGSATPGRFYRIIDYTTKVNETDSSIISANHQFDIVVLATSSNTIHSSAWAIKHENTTYFDNTDFSKWEIKYTLKNNYAWSPTSNGTGTIFYMKDEFDNECNYDFKNIMFSYNGKNYYTFNIYYKNATTLSYESADLSLIGSAKRNRLGTYPINKSILSFYCNNSFNLDNYKHMLKIYDNKIQDNTNKDFVVILKKNAGYETLTISDNTINGSDDLYIVDVNAIDGCKFGQNSNVCFEYGPDHTIGCSGMSLIDLCFEKDSSAYFYRNTHSNVNFENILFGYHCAASYNDGGNSTNINNIYIEPFCNNVVLDDASYITFRRN